MTELLYKDETYAIIGACMKVHANLGCGFLEAVYQEALAKEFRKQSIPCQQQQKLAIFYENEKLNKYYVADFVCYDKIIVEIKSATQLLPVNYKQLINYLAATRFEVGLMINFGTKSLTYKRMVHPCSPCNPPKSV